MAKAFGEAEHRGRLERARRALREQGLEVGVCTSPEHLYYFSGYDAHTQFSLQALVIGVEDDSPTLVLRDVDLPNAEEWASVADIRAYHHGQSDPASLIVAAVREREPGSAVGVGLSSYSLPGAFALRLVEALRPLEVRDVSAALEAVRLVKSPAEMACVREAARLANLGLEAAREALAPGLTEIELAGRLEGAMRAQGSEYSAMPTWLSSGARSCGSHKTPTTKPIAAGECVKMEFAGISRRYHAVTMQTIWAGEPSAEARRLYEAVAAGLSAGSKEVAPGAPVADAEAAAFAVLEAAGIEVGRHSRFGYGVGAAYPPSWLEGLDITRESAQVFAEGMAFVLHTAVAAPAERTGILIGGAYALTARGLEVLSGGPLALYAR